MSSLVLLGGWDQRSYVLVGEQNNGVDPGGVGSGDSLEITGKWMTGLRSSVGVLEVPFGVYAGLTRLGCLNSGAVRAGDASGKIDGRQAPADFFLSRCGFLACVQLRDETRTAAEE